MRTYPMLKPIQFNLTISSKACRLDFWRWTILINQLTSQSKFSTKNSNIFLLIKYVSFVSKSVIVRIIWFQFANERWSTACRMKLICSWYSMEGKNRQVSEYFSVSCYKQINSISPFYYIFADGISGVSQKACRF